MNDLNILVIEDELIIYMHLVKTLNSFGFKNVYVAKTSDKAMSIVNSRKIDLIFSDIKINGEIDGIDTASKIQAICNIPVVFITVYKDKQILKRASKINTLGYLIKPYRVDELEALIYMAIEKYELNTKNSLISIGEYNYNKNRNILYENETEIELSKKEKLLVQLIFNNLNKTISYKVLEEIIWNDNFVSENTRRTFLYRFKNKFPKLNLKIEKNVGIKLIIN